MPFAMHLRGGAVVGSVALEEEGVSFFRDRRRSFRGAGAWASGGVGNCACVVVGGVMGSMVAGGWGASGAGLASRL